MLKTIVRHIDFLTEKIEMLDQEVAKRVRTNQEDLERLDSIPGIATRMGPTGIFSRVSSLTILIVLDVMPSLLNSTIEVMLHFFPY
jgi:transposase